MAEIITGQNMEAADGKIKFLSLRQNFSWTFIGNVIYAVCQWGILVVLAKTGTPETVGQFALGLAVTAPIFMMTNLNLRAVQATDATNKYNFGDYLRLRIYTTIIAISITIIIVNIAEYKIYTSLIIISIALIKSVESLSDIFYGLFQKNEVMNITAKAMIIKGVSTVIAISITFFITNNLLFSMVCVIIIKIFTIFIYDYRKGKIFLEKSTIITHKEANLKQPCIKMLYTDNLFKLAALAAPLGIVMMFNSLNTNIPRYLLERSFGERELGIFAAMAYLMVAGTTVISALGQSASPRLAKQFAGQDIIGFRRLLFKLIFIGIVCGLLGVLVVFLGGKEILTHLYGSEYGEYADVLILIMIASGLSYVSSFLGVALTAARHFKIQIPITILSFVVILTASWVLVPESGMKGAAIGLIYMYFAQIPLKFFLLCRLMGEHRGHT